MGDDMRTWTSEAQGCGVKWSGIALAAVCSLTLGMAPAVANSPKVGQFEIKSLDAEQGEVEIEVQSDASVNNPRRKALVEEDEVEFDENTVTNQRHEIGINFGLANWLKVGLGIELEEERGDEPASFAEAEGFDSLKWTEIALEGLVVLVPVKTNGIGLGVYVEAEIPKSEEARTVTLGPIFQAVHGKWSSTSNLGFVRFLGGEEGEIDEKWDFIYATQIKYQATDTLGIALESYGTIDRLGSTGNQTEESKFFGDQDQHRIGPVMYYTFKQPASPSAKDDDDDGKKEGDDDDDDEGGSVTVGLGYLFGLNEETPDGTVKLGVEVEF